MKIAHLTDIHIPPDESFVHGIDTKSNFKTVLKAIASEKPELLVLGGDLAAESGEVEAYQWIERILSDSGIPYLITLGNHDDYGNSNKVFKNNSKQQEGLFFIEEFAHVRIIGLDSSKAVISENQLRWLSGIKIDDSKLNLLFVHHPPVDCGCLFMDENYPLENRNELFQLLKQRQEISYIFCGHYHTAKTICVDGKTIFITPSSMLQIHQMYSEFKEESQLMGWRMIECDAMELRTSVHFLQPE